MVLYLVLLPANWVCRNNLNLCIHVNSSYFLGEAIVTIPSFSPFHVSVLQSALFCLAFYIADVQSVASALHSFWGCFITQSSDVSLGESRGDLEERRKTIVVCVLFSSPLPHTLKVETSKGYCNFVAVVIIIPLNPWLRSLVFHTELSGFSLFWMEKYTGKPTVFPNRRRRVNIL